MEGGTIVKELYEKIVVFIVANILLLMFRENSFSENERHHSKDWRPIKENEQRNRV